MHKKAMESFYPLTNHALTVGSSAQVARKRVLSHVTMHMFCL